MDAGERHNVNKSDMPFARPFAKLILIVGIVLLIVGRLTDQFGTWDLLKYFGILFAAAAILSVFSKKEEDSFLKLCGHLLIVAGVVGGAGYGFYHYVLRDASLNHMSDRVDDGVQKTGHAVGHVVKGGFDRFMNGIEKTTDEHHQ